MIHFKLILFFCVFSLNLQAQSGDEYDTNEYDCNEYEAFCAIEKERNPLCIFPNPTTDYFEVRNWTNIEGYLFDLQGRLIRKIDVSTIINISDLPCAMYVLKVENQILKIIKQ